VIEMLVERREVAADQDLLRLFNRSLTLDVETQRIRERLAERFRTLGLQAPAPDDVMAELGVERQTGRKIVQLMIADRELVKINDDMTVAAEALAKLVHDVRALKATTSKLGVREFKELTGLSRKFAVPLLEHLDGQRVTRRVGDDRIIL
jgi:selenocysteine-specific elongation factor